MALQPYYLNKTHCSNPNCKERISKQQHHEQQQQQKQEQQEEQEITKDQSKHGDNNHNHNHNHNNHNEKIRTKHPKEVSTLSEIMGISVESAYQHLKYTNHDVDAAIDLMFNNQQHWQNRNE